ncbi:hypothetical protein WJX81_004998 [Elliptochloris bilobata]|uniref:MOSC domain-containing protein n=1 Tax=Elliptochloris bilobata TaxID=381761 RepID=A0AAW1S0G4_9CHLO
MGGIAVEKVHIGPTGGVNWDRTWLVTREDGRFLTQRQLPKMALIETSLPPEVLLEPAADLPTSTMIVTCWEWAGTARDEGDFAANWLREVLGKPVRLVRYMGKAGVGDADGDPARRPVDPDFGKGYENTFSDGFPIHLTAEESLVDLNKRLEAPLPMDRFRANIVVAGGEPWAEDEWAGLRIGSLEFSSVKPCGPLQGSHPNPTMQVTDDRGTLGSGREVWLLACRPANELVV